MRRIAVPANGERGGISVIVAMMMVVLLGFAAIAIDVSMLHSERVQLQNGSDAAALMVAQKCAKDVNDAECSDTWPRPSSLASELVNGNAVDGQSNIKAIALDTLNRTVSVKAAASENGSAPNTVSLFFARALGFTNSEVNATSTVAWGSPRKGTAPFPITVSICQVKDKSDVMQLLQLHGDNKNDDCYFGPSGSFVSGGFGGLSQQDSVCGAIIDIASSQAGGDTGSNPPKFCDQVLNSWAADISMGKELLVLLPVFDQVTGTGSGAVYGLRTFAAFKVAGWRFGPPGLPFTFHNTSAYVPDALACTSPCRGIIGTFVKYVSLVDGYTLGEVDRDGVTVVELTR